MKHPAAAQGRIFGKAVNRPAVTPRGVGADRPAVRAAPDNDTALVGYLRRFSHPGAVNAIVGAPEMEARPFYTPDCSRPNFTRGKSPLDPLLDGLLREHDVERPCAMAVQSISAAELLPGFAEGNATPLIDAAAVPRLWLGNAIRVATHYDLMEISA